MLTITATVDVDVSYLDVAKQVVIACDEDELLDIMAREEDSLARQSKNEAEKAFAVESARKLRELAVWFRENPV